MKKSSRIWESLIGRSTTVCIALALMIVQTGCEAEKAKWNLARAINLSDLGQIDEAISLSQIAMDQDPDNCQIKLHLARLLAENGKGEIAVALCDEHHECFPNDLPAREVRSTCLQYIGRFDEALAEYKKSLSSRVARTPVELNNLAYARALANKELCMAAEDIQTAIDSKESEYWGTRKFPLAIRTIVAAGLISRHVDGRRRALRLLDRKIEQYESGLAYQEARVKNLVTEQIATTFPSSKLQQKQVLNARAKREIQKNSLAVMLTTRALILEDCKRSECVDADRLRIQELGFDVSRLAQELPSDLACLQALSTATIYLDTRGFVSALQPWRSENSDSKSLHLTIDPTCYSSYQAAIEDLDLAVLAAQFSQAAMNSPLYNSMEISTQKVERRKKMARRVTAILLYHRMKAHERGGNAKAAARDQCRIEALGFPPDSSLF